MDKLSQAVNQALTTCTSKNKRRQHSKLTIGNTAWLCMHLKSMSRMIGAASQMLSQLKAPKSPARRHSVQTRACLFAHAQGTDHPRLDSANRDPCRYARCKHQTWRGLTAARCDQTLQTTNLQHKAQLINTSTQTFSRYHGRSAENKNIHHVLHVPSRVAISDSAEMSQQSPIWPCFGSLDVAPSIHSFAGAPLSDCSRIQRRSAGLG